MDLNVSAALALELHGDEGERLKVYDDATGKPIGKGSHVIGNPTIAVGRNLTARGISKAESAMMLANDFADLEAELVALLPWLPTVSASRQVAVYSLYFNTGLGNAPRFLSDWPHFLAQLLAGEFAAAADNLQNSQPWAGEVGAGRASRLSNLIRYG